MLFISACSAARPFEEDDAPQEAQATGELTPAQTLTRLFAEAESLIMTPAPVIEAPSEDEGPPDPQLIKISQRIVALTRHPKLDLHPSTRDAMRARAWFLLEQSTEARQAALEDLRMLLGTRSEH